MKFAVFANYLPDSRHSLHYKVYIQIGNSLIFIQLASSLHLLNCHVRFFFFFFFKKGGCAKTSQDTFHTFKHKPIIT